MKVIEYVVLLTSTYNSCLPEDRTTCTDWNRCMNWDREWMGWTREWTFPFRVTEPRSSRT